MVAAMMSCKRFCSRVRACTNQLIFSTATCICCWRLCCRLLVRHDINQLRNVPERHQTALHAWHQELDLWHITNIRMPQ
jgi:hypothetical protein